MSFLLRVGSGNANFFLVRVRERQANDKTTNKYLQHHSEYKEGIQQDT